MEMLRVGVASGFPRKKSSFCVVDGVEYVGYVCVYTSAYLCVCGVCSHVGWGCVCLCVDEYLHIL